MKTRIPLSGRSLLVWHTILISVLYIPSIALAIEPIGTIGQPLPEQHAFLSNEAIVRVTPARIQINSLKYFEISSISDLLCESSFGSVGINSLLISDIEYVYRYGSICSI